MPRFWTRSILLIGLLVDVFCTARLNAEEPTIESLVRGIPVFTAGNERLRKIKLKCDVRLLELPVEIDFLWIKPDDFTVLVTTGEKKSPIVFLTEKKAVVFDASTQSARLLEDYAPQLSFRVIKKDDKNQIDFNAGISSLKDSKIWIDLPSFFMSDSPNKSIERIMNDHWQITVPSSTGKSTATAVFRDSSPYPIRSFELRVKESETPVFVVRDIAMNEGVQEHSLRFPALESFPIGMTIVQNKDINLPDIERPLEFLTLLMRAYNAQRALLDPKFRSFSYFKDVDWDEAAKKNEELGPAMRELFKMPNSRPIVPPKAAAGNGSSDEPAKTGP